MLHITSYTTKNPKLKAVSVSYSGVPALAQAKEDAPNPRLSGIVARVAADPAYVARRCAELGEAGRLSRRHRRKNDPSFRLLSALRGRTRTALKGKGKSKRTMMLVGCTLAELRAHLEKQFVAGMTWANYGAWHIDHIRPCASFDLLDPGQQAQCFHFSNLQPLWAMDNFRKGAKW